MSEELDLEIAIDLPEEHEEVDMETLQIENDHMDALRKLIQESTKLQESIEVRTAAVAVLQSKAMSMGLGDLATEVLGMLNDSFNQWIYQGDISLIIAGMDSLSSELTTSLTSMEVIPGIHAKAYMIHYLAQISLATGEKDEYTTVG